MVNSYGENLSDFYKIENELSYGSRWKVQTCRKYMSRWADASPTSIDSGGIRWIERERERESIILRQHTDKAKSGALFHVFLLKISMQYKFFSNRTDVGLVKNVPKVVPRLPPVLTDASGLLSI